MTVAWLGMGLGLARYNRRPWSPALVPGLQPSYVPGVSRSKGLLWQNSAKTVPAVNAGDPIRVATCPYTGQDVAAPSDAARMTLTADSGKFGANGNGSSSVLLYTFPTFSGPWTVYAAGYLQAVGSGQNWVPLGDDNPVMVTYYGSSPAWFLENDAAGEVSYGGAMPTGSAVVRVRRDASNNVFVRVNGTEHAFSPATLTGTFTFNQFGGTRYQSIYSNPANHTMATLVYNQAVSAANDALITSFLQGLVP